MEVSPHGRGSENMRDRAPGGNARQNSYRFRYVNPGLENSELIRVTANQHRADRTWVLDNRVDTHAEQLHDETKEVSMHARNHVKC